MILVTYHLLTYFSPLGPIHIHTSIIKNLIYKKRLSLYHQKIDIYINVHTYQNDGHNNHLIKSKTLFGTYCSLRYIPLQKESIICAYKSENINKGYTNPVYLKK